MVMVDRDGIPAEASLRRQLRNDCVNILRFTFVQDNSNVELLRRGRSVSLVGSDGIAQELSQFDPPRIYICGCDEVEVEDRCEVGRVIAA